MKNSIEDSDSCAPPNDSACEVPDFKFLSEEGGESDELGALKSMRADGENLLIQCSGINN